MKPVQSATDYYGPDTFSDDYYSQLLSVPNPKEVKPEVEKPKEDVKENDSKGE